MKHLFCIIAIVLFLCDVLNSQPSLTGFTVQDMNGKTVSIEDVTKHDTDKILVLYTWFASHCLPCMKIMDYYLNEKHDEQQKKYGIKFVALNINKSDIATAKKAINGDLKFQLKRAHHFSDVEGNYMRINNINSAPQLFIIVNGQVVHHENGFYTKMGDVKNNANHIKDVVDAFSSNIRLFDQFGKICKEEKNAISPDNVKRIPDTKIEISKAGDVYKIVKSKINGKKILSGFSNDAYGLKLVGKLIEYQEDGINKKDEYNFDNQSVLDGTQISYYTNGKIFNERLMKNGKLMSSKYFTQNGEYLESGDYKNGEGLLITYNTNGKVISKESFVNFILNGTKVTYDENSPISSESYYENGVINGITRVFLNGIQIDSSYYINGIKARFPRKRKASNDIKNIDDGEPDSSETFKVVEMMPRFPGCEGMDGTAKEKAQCAQIKMLEYIYKNLKYPQLARENGVEGTVVLNFVIAKDGYIDDIKIVRDIGAGCGDAAASAVDSMNDMNERWIPGTQRGRKVRVLYTLPIKFKLEG